MADRKQPAKRPREKATEVDALSMQAGKTVAMQFVKAHPQEFGKLIMGDNKQAKKATKALCKVLCVPGAFDKVLAMMKKKAPITLDSAVCKLRRNPKVDAMSESFPSPKNLKGRNLLVIKGTSETVEEQSFAILPLEKFPKLWQRVICVKWKERKNYPRLENGMYSIALSQEEIPDLASMMQDEVDLKKEKEEGEEEEDEEEEEREEEEDEEEEEEEEEEGRGGGGRGGGRGGRGGRGGGRGGRGGGRRAGRHSTPPGRRRRSAAPQVARPRGAPSLLCARSVSAVDARASERARRLRCGAPRPARSERRRRCSVARSGRALRW